MPYEDVLVHTAVPIVKRRRTTTVDGDTGGTGDEPGTPFDCCLFLPQGSEQSTPFGRQVRRPTLLVAPEDSLGQPVALPFNAEVDVIAEELNLAEGRPAEANVRWQVDGSPQPFGKPGDDVIGYQVTVKRVEE
jgi:hypothetical protein